MWVKQASKYRLHVFDADSTIRGCNVEGQHTPRDPDEWYLLPGRQERLASLDGRFAFASNQAGVARGDLSLGMAFGLLQLMALSALGDRAFSSLILLCPHAQDAGCACRKPRPGMLLSAMDHFQCKPEETLFVGDLPTDEQAAKAAGCDFSWAKDFFA